MYTIIISVISGVLLFILSEAIKETWLISFRRYKQIKFEALYAIKYYANIYTDPFYFGDASKEIQVLMEMPKRC